MDRQPNLRRAAQDIRVLGRIESGTLAGYLPAASFQKGLSHEVLQLRR